MFLHLGSAQGPHFHLQDSKAGLENPGVGSLVLLFMKYDSR